MATIRHQIGAPFVSSVQMDDAEICATLLRRRPTKWLGFKPQLGIDRMDQQQRRECLVASLYEAAVGEDGWAPALSAIANETGADSYHLLVWASGEPSPRFSTAWGTSEKMEAAYRTRYGAIDPRRLLIAQLPAGKWMACHQRFDKCVVDRSEFFQDFLIPGGLRYLLGTRVIRSQGADVFFGMHRANGRRPFEERERGFVDRLTVHFQRAARLWLETEGLRQQARIGEAALDAVELGVITTDSEGRLATANRYAGALLKEGRVLRLKKGFLCATRFDDSELLAAALRLSAVTRRPQSLCVRKSGDLHDEWCCVTVMPLPASMLPESFASASMLLLLSPGNRRRAPTVKQLMALFALTPAEARLARAMAAGESIGSYAGSCGLSMATVRTQLRSVFEKTGAQRQVDLARQMAYIPPVRDESAVSRA